MNGSVAQPHRTFARAGCLILSGLLLGLVGCSRLPGVEAGAQPRPGQPAPTPEGPAAVDSAIARPGNIQQEREYTGTTQPVRLISLRSQVEGQLLDLSVTVGDAVRRGQALARIDSTVLNTNVAAAQAEVAARQAEVAEARAEVSDAQTQVERARVQLQQSQSDLARLQALFREGAIPEQQLQQARTEVSTAQQLLRSAQQQVKTRQQSVAAVQQRVAAQQAVVAREQRRQADAVLRSPVSGLVVEQPTEAGNLVQAGSEVLKLGDFSQIKVVVQISELELSQIRLGQSVEVRLDALPEQTFRGQISRISPAADPIARLIPIDITLPNPDARIGSGLLARVVLTRSGGGTRVVVPESALRINERRRGGAERGGGNAAAPGNSPSGTQGSGGPAEAPPGSDRPADPAASSRRDVGTIYVVTGSGDAARVSARPVTLGRRGDSQVEILSGLREGDRFVVRSSQPLQDGDPIRLSILSE